MPSKGHYSIEWHRGDINRTKLLKTFEEASLLALYEEHPKEFIDLTLKMINTVKKFKNPDGSEKESE